MTATVLNKNFDLEIGILEIYIGNLKVILNGMELKGTPSTAFWLFGEPSNS